MNANIHLNDAICLLGGHDLEMVEIKKMLIAKGIHYHDKNLRWDNARLSQYKEVLNTRDFFIGVELTNDIIPPQNYFFIDHHNGNSDKPASIEQIAVILDIELSHDQQLVAANDKGYIPAMIEMGATQVEIADVRCRDREAQGVTEEDERVAEESIREHLTIEQGITVVKSLTSRFSTITDRLYPCDRLLIYTDTELTYYGEGVSKLIRVFDHFIKEKIAYSGGGKKGFFGLTEKGVNVSGCETTIHQIVNLLTNGK